MLYLKPEEFPDNLRYWEDEDNSPFKFFIQFLKVLLMIGNITINAIFLNLTNFKIDIYERIKEKASSDNHDDSERRI